MIYKSYWNSYRIVQGMKIYQKYWNSYRIIQGIVMLCLPRFQAVDRDYKHTSLYDWYGKVNFDCLINEPKLMPLYKR